MHGPVFLLDSFNGYKLWLHVQFSKRYMILKFTNTLDSLEYLLIAFLKIHRLSILFKNSCLLFTSRFG